MISSFRPSSSSLLSFRSCRTLVSAVFLSIMHHFIELSFLYPPLSCRSLTLSARFAVHSLVLSLPHLKLKLTFPYPSIPHHMTTSLSLIIPLLFVKSPPSCYLYLVTSPEYPLDFPSLSSLLPTAPSPSPTSVPFVCCFLSDSLGGFF